eukprot:SAG31_NODE_2657_length_5286_cov_7.817235_5_plen_161_part_00
MLIAPAILQQDRCVSLTKSDDRGVVSLTQISGRSPALSSAHVSFLSHLTCRPNVSQGPLTMLAKKTVPCRFSVETTNARNESSSSSSSSSSLLVFAPHYFAIQSMNNRWIQTFGLSNVNLILLLNARLIYIRAHYISHKKTKLEGTAVNLLQPYYKFSTE